MAFSTRAMVASAKGSAEVLQPAVVDLLWPRRPDDVLVRLRAASLNPADVFFRQLGGYLDNGAPLVLGHDGAGVVEAVGSSVDSVQLGDRVCFCNGGIGGDAGTYAEHAVVPQTQLAKIPDGIDFATAAALPLVAITATEALIERAGVSSGEFVLVHGGAGGTGHLAIQLAKHSGARVATTVSTADKAKRAMALGADCTILYRSEDFVAAGGAFTGGRGFDVALDNIGGETLTRTYAAMAPYGRISTLMGLAADDRETTAYNRNLTIHAVMMLTPMWLGLTEHLARQAAIVRRVLDHVAAGRVRVDIARKFPLCEVANAHLLMEAGGVAGKIVLEMG